MSSVWRANVRCEKHAAACVVADISINSYTFVNALREDSAGADVRVNLNTNSACGRTEQRRQENENRLAGMTLESTCSRFARNGSVADIASILYATPVNDVCERISFALCRE